MMPTTGAADKSFNQDDPPNLSKILNKGMTVHEAFRALGAEQTVPFGSFNFYYYACTTPFFPGWTVYMTFRFTGTSKSERVLSSWEFVRNVRKSPYPTTV
jgi:hypothetical protein